MCPWRASPEQRCSLGSLGISVLTSLRGWSGLEGKGLVSAFAPEWRVGGGGGGEEDGRAGGGWVGDPAIFGRIYCEGCEAVLRAGDGLPHGYQVKSRSYHVTSHDCPFGGGVVGVGSQGPS
jgi:hypothetical protein